VFFGSRVVGSSPGRGSAADLFVIVRDYRAFYERFAKAAPGPGPRLLELLNRWLPPNIVSFRPDRDAVGAKLFVIDRRAFLRETGPSARDHFCRGRLCQKVEIVWAASDEAHHELEGRIGAARWSTLEWALLECPPAFDVQTYCERMLARSYRAEIRPESPSRVQEVFDAQRDFWVETYAPILRMSPELAEHGEEWRIVGVFSRLRRLRWSWYFSVSRTRATLRWAKYVLTFEGWLDYIVHKVERRTGQRVEITPFERRWPLLTLWPKAWRALRAARRGDAGTNTR
jgi:hypothetical protein